MQRSWAIILPLAIGFGLPLACSSDEDDDDDSGYTPVTGGSPGVPTGGSSASSSETTGGMTSTPDEETGGTEPEPDPTGGRTSSSSGGSISGQEAETCLEIEGLEQTCLSQASFSQPNPVNILLVIDKSGSMADETVYGGTSKWAAITEALSTALTESMDNPNLALGLAMFPAKNTDPLCGEEDCCEMSSDVYVNVTTAAFSVPDIITELQDTSPGGLTPTSAALDQALSYYAGTALSGDKYVLLATDGGPNCNAALTCDEAECTTNLDGRCSQGGNCCETSPLWCVDHAATQAKIADLAANDVKTIVVGIPGTEDYAQWLNEFAVAGGAEAPEGNNRSYYEVSADGGVGTLTDTFREITVNLIRSCRIQMRETPPAFSVDLVNVAIDCKAIPGGMAQPPDQGAAGAAPAPTGNWFVDTSTEPPTIEVLGTYCEQIESGVERVDVVVGCQMAL